MNTRRRIVLIVVLALAGIVVFRGTLFRQLITYHYIGARKNHVATDTALTARIETRAAGNAAADVHDVVALALDMTADELHFCAWNCAVEPDKLIHTHAAHCVGYAAFCAAVCNHLFTRHGMAHTWKARPCAGQLFLWGTNLHRYFDTPFLRDHDFVLIENKTTGECLAVDPVVNDYLRIDRVTFYPPPRGASVNRKDRS